jgi:capsular exopolysaccharide synthesis family protein
MQLLGAPLLGTVPVDADNDPVHSLDDPKSVLSEAYLSLRTSLSFATDHGVPKSFAVTSTRPAEGKSTTSVALARALARSNVRTLLVDGDMRSPSLHSLFEVKNRLGLSNFLSGTEDLDELVHTTPVANLSLMTAGPQPPNAAELLSGERFRHLLQLLGTRFDHIVVDAPPVLGLADAPLIGNAVEGVVFVLEAHGTKKGSARVAISRLRAAHAQVIGGVITKFDAQKATYGYGYDYGYGYSYGDKKRS